MKELYRYIWKVSGRQQVLLSVLAIALFLIELVPLELQRRIVNAAVARNEFGFIGTLCLLYVAVTLVHGGMKLAMNLYRGAVGEAATLRLRKQAHAPGRSSTQDGEEIPIIVSEVEVVGGFIASSFSVPMLSGGILLSVFGYMLYTQPWLALVALLLFIPQALFIPLLQSAINRRTAARIKVLRSLSVDIVKVAADGTEPKDEKKYDRQVDKLYGLNMQIFRRKFSMTFLMNLMHHLGVIGILAVGSWLVLQGKTEVGTIVAFISGLSRMNDPWGDLVGFFRDLTNTGVRFRMIMSTLGKEGS